MLVKRELIVRVSDRKLVTPVRREVGPNFRAVAQDGCRDRVGLGRETAPCF